MWGCLYAHITLSSPSVPLPQDMDVAVALLKIAPGVSRVHASRRVFEQLQQQKVREAVGCSVVAG